MPTPTIVQKILDWLRAGYPEGVPKQDYIPLLAILGRHMTPEEATLVLAELAVTDPKQLSSNPESTVRAAIEAVTSSPALESDVRRIEERLTASGWDLG